MINDIIMANKKKIIVSGIRPTGKMHLGNYHGAVKHWVKLQHEYDCYFFIADLHALTTHYSKSNNIKQDTQCLLEDLLTVGLNSKYCKIFIQSQIPEHAELSLLLSTITPVSWLERVPTYKDQQQKLTELDLSTYGFLGYPLLQSADVLLYNAEYVPVGEDQTSHIELTREIVRRFNHIYGFGKKILLEPKLLLSDAPKVIGVDGQKMSKSYNNTIAIAEEQSSIEKKIKTMPTDPARIKRTDCGDPDKCPVWQLHKIYSNEEVKTWADAGCRSAKIGCLDCKGALLKFIEQEQQIFREQSKLYKENKNLINITLQESKEQASIVAKDTLIKVKTAMGII
jgi:tryptophanyl-tRNA synthetase